MGDGGIAAVDGRRKQGKRFRPDNAAVWAQLLRVPNLFTVPGDPTAGFFLAVAAAGRAGFPADHRLFGIVLVSLLAYCTGLLQNDYFDLEEDRKERPNRPLPANKVQPSTVFRTSILFAAAALLLSFRTAFETGILTAMLLLAVTAYNHTGKRIAIVGPLLMGCCRGLNLLLGASLLGVAGILNPAVVTGAVFLCLYIAAVTHIAAGETARYRAGGFRWIPASLLSALFLSLVVLAGPGFSGMWVFGLPAAAAVLWAIYCGSLLVKDAPPPVIQKTIGRFIRGLLLIQAALAGTAGLSGLIVVCLLLAAWPVSQKLAKRFYAS